MTDAVALARDTAHRARALDNTRSFLVQAPAGSGKTELLIQRFLALLAHVERPERIVAMTFTRKAAAEMRERVIAALRDADADVAVADPHHATTRRLAKAALATDRARGWNLLAHPAQLAIYTIDAFCAAIARQAPLATGMGGTTPFVERADPLYRQAARDALATARADDPAWRTLLAHLDNNADRVVALLAGMLGKRDQWLLRLLRSEPVALRDDLEQILQQEIDAELRALRALLPARELAALARCAAYAAENLLREGDGVEFAHALARCAANGGVPPIQWQHHDDWQALAEWLLLVNEPQLRKTMDRRDGVPGKGNGHGAGERDTQRTAMLALLESLAAYDGVAAALHVARHLPPPHYDDASWAMVAALLDVLPRVAAQLVTTFADQRAVDFVQGTLAALAALGSPDAPTDLLLRLDLRIDHLLVDEFQDTSAAQYQLIERLTAGWSPGDGRTFFAVGDPMQSIYRFRNAEVRLFLEAQAAGRIGEVPVEFIDLTRNFRSQGALVAWVNAVFPAVLAARNDPWRGAVAFAAAVPARPSLPDVRPTLDLLPTAESEAQQVVQRIVAALGSGATDVAVLVRKRADLTAILPALRLAGIEYAAVELDPLGARQAVLDLTSLTHALIQPADRLAWLAVLRAPWCGLTLPDLIKVTAACDEGLPQVLARRDAIDGLSDDGRARLERIADALLPALAAAGRAPLTDRVRGAWLALGGPVCLDDALDFDTADSFFALLAAHEHAGDVRDWDALAQALEVLRATPAAASSARVQVMTLHHAKGLEFDTVILPGLERRARGDSAELLRWRARPGGLMVAPIKARSGDEDPVYAYLKLLAKAEAEHELGRLLYVGATRAKTRLHLTATTEITHEEENGATEWKKPASGSALARLWDAVAASVGEPVTPSAPRDNAAPGPAPRLRRLPVSWTVPPLPDAVALPSAAMATARASAPLFEWAHATAAAIGTVAHRLLAQMAREGIERWNPDRIDRSQARVRTELLGEGVDAAQLAQAVADVLATVRAVLADPRGRWLFDPGHADAASEWALAGVDAGAVVHVTLDRTFVIAGERWIVDFKTGRHQGGDTAAFLDREVERYRLQLARYARIVQGVDSRPIRIALYFPLVPGGWREWAFA